MKEYSIENQKRVDISKLTSPNMPASDYEPAHKGLVIPCHDIMIEYNKGLLLVIRKRHPVKDIPWPIGGRILRGVETEESLYKKVREETNLELEGVIELDTVRAFFDTDPFNHGRGTDNIVIRYFGRGKGELKLDGLHSNPRIISPEQYTEELRSELHPYVRDFMDLAIPLVRR